MRDCLDKNVPMVQSSSEMLKPLISFDDIKKTHPDNADMVNYERYAVIYCPPYSLDCV